MKIFESINEIQIRFNDIDIAGHINNAVYQYYYDYGKLRYFDNVFQDKINWQKQGFVLVKIEIEYFSPIYLYDKIEVITKTSKIKNKSLIIEQVIRPVGDNNPENIKSKAISVMVAYDFLKKSSIKIPNLWKNLIVNIV